MIVVLDKSGSMGGQKIEMTKEAAKAPLALLKDTDSFGVVAFDYNFYWPVKFQPASNRTSISQAISTIIAGGETNIYPAFTGILYPARRRLDSSEARHLLSDGRSLPDDFEGLTKKMADAKITVSTVAVEMELIVSFSRKSRCGERGVRTTSKIQRPSRRSFTKKRSLRLERRCVEESFKACREEECRSVQRHRLQHAPPLLGYVATKSKDTSEVLLESKRKDPILARWQYGLGKTAAFLSDLKDRWAVDWLRWNGYPKFWSQLVRETMRRQDNNEFDFRW
jgi:hypothetical protein